MARDEKKTKSVNLHLGETYERQLAAVAAFKGVTPTELAREWVEDRLLPEMMRLERAMKKLNLSSSELP